MSGESPAIVGISGLSVAAQDVDASREAWCRLSGAENVPALIVGGVAVAISPAGQGPTGLVSATFASHDLSALVPRLQRRGLRVSSANTLDLAGVGWRLAGGTGVVMPRAGGDLDGLDHLVVASDQPDRAAGLYGARLGLDLRLERTFARHGMSALFFACGTSVVEVVTPAPPPAQVGERDSFGGIAWRTGDLDRTRDRLVGDGVEVSEIREGRKPGTRVATVRDPQLHVPTLLIG